MSMKDLVTVFFIAAAAMVFAAGDIASSTNATLLVVSWGEPVQGARLSITTTNNVFRIPSSTVVRAVTDNASTNEIRVDIAFPTFIFDLLLTNSTGKVYHVTTPLTIRGPRQIVTLRPGERRTDDIPTTFRAGIEPGDYTLTATRSFSARGQDFVLA